MTTPLVSICSITYNHAPFIRQCLDGFLMQQCNFPIEIIINDDCSTDGTTEIIREYAAKYPDKIFPIFHEENLYSQGVRGMFQKFVYPKARGKYIALCEGDDYWTDPLKLQKQVDFLESHPDYSMCFHKAKVIAQVGRKYNDPFANLEEREYLPHEIIPHWIIPTASIVFRSNITIPTHKYFETGDTIVHAACVEAGRILCMGGTMSIYRLHGGGWSANASNTSDQRVERNLLTIVGMEEVFSSRVTKTLKTRLAFCCFVQLLRLLRMQHTVRLSALLKAIYYSNWSLLYFIIIIPTIKILKLMGFKIDFKEPL